MKDLKELIKLYVATRDPSTFEDVLSLWASKTNEQNHLKITKTLANQPNCSELELSMYIYEIAKPGFTELIPISKLKLKTFQDNDAIEDLEEALIKIKN